MNTKARLQPHCCVHQGAGEASRPLTIPGHFRNHLSITLVHSDHRLLQALGSETREKVSCRVSAMHHKQAPCKRRGPREPWLCGARESAQEIEDRESLPRVLQEG